MHRIPFQETEPKIDGMFIPSRRILELMRPMQIGLLGLATEEDFSKYDERIRKTFSESFILAIDNIYSKLHLYEIEGITLFDEEGKLQSLFFSTVISFLNILPKDREKFHNEFCLWLEKEIFIKSDRVIGKMRIHKEKGEFVLSFLETPPKIEKEAHARQRIISVAVMELIPA